MRIYRKQIERITIIGNRNESSQAFDYCLEYGYRIKRSGPKPVAKYKVDPTKFKIIAEREAE